MPLFFLIPLTICVITGYISKRCSDEVGYLAGLFAIISLVLSLVLAPWEIQVLLLIVVLVTTKKLLQRNECKLKFEENGNNHQNQISQSETLKKQVTRQYRGANYQVDIANTELIESEINGKYRGNPWIIRRIKTIVGKSD
ncbi:DUF4278 domain-containing protein [Rivularia sp. UHCC 0363]|uniref:DUF4278 domain-containing protein n=1 Tax=Rivularia sp. UHCC 0363 TaxID=3110244 RepID=UPI002B1FC6C5|nr:DUF4278 domain-containing protein [Rivularia sp. UHCC 0363]MEA5596594.1 DUF4278 domain-containing protein [Rivularia sp. UHCC 0363]